MARYGRSRKLPSNFNRKAPRSRRWRIRRKGKLTWRDRRVYNIAYGAQLATDGKKDILNKITGPFRYRRSAHAAINKAKRAGQPRKPLF